MIRQLFTESVLLSVMAGALGALLAVWAVDRLRHLAPGDIPRMGDPSIDRRVLGFTLLLLVATGLIFGLAPAMKVTGVPHRAARSGRVRSLLVISEVALALLLAIGAGL